MNTIIAVGRIIGNEVHWRISPLVDEDEADKLENPCSYPDYPLDGLRPAGDHNDMPPPLQDMIDFAAELDRYDGSIEDDHDFIRFGGA